MMTVSYQAFALIMRFVFCALGAAIAGYALYTCLHDADNAKLLRREAGYTGILIGGGRNPEKIYLQIEGEIGSGKQCDILTDERGAKGVCLHYEIEGGKLMLTALRGSVRRAGKPREDDADNGLTVRSGESFLIGKQEYKFMMLKPRAEAMSPASRGARGDGR